MLRTSHGAPRPKGKGEAPEKPARPLAKPAAKRPAARTTKRATLPGAAREAKAEKPEKDDRTEAAPKKTKGAVVPGASSAASDESREIAIQVAIAGLDKKASALEVIDVAGRVDYADFLVLMSGRSDRHVTALASGIEDALRKRGKRALAVEGLPHANWVLMDFGDVVVHVFQDDARSAYDIDALWMDARRVPVPITEPPA
ncbi:MAG: Iojap protein [Labilithrix sp.]|nr:Iojap protein [Labilithrix sp.]